MLELDAIDLRNDPAAATYVKSERVDVAFARAAGELLSREGPNAYRVGDALITGSAGDRWSVSGDRFAQKYEPMPPTKAGDDGAYQARPVPVLARQMGEAFSARRSAGGDRLYGQAGDWVLQYAPGDYGVAEHSRFCRVYRRADAA